MHLPQMNPLTPMRKYTVIYQVDKTFISFLSLPQQMTTDVVA